jgi:hypothetical protein
MASVLKNFSTLLLFACLLLFVMRLCSWHQPFVFTLAVLDWCAVLRRRTGGQLYALDWFG